MNYYNDKLNSYIYGDVNTLINLTLINKNPLIEHIFNKTLNDLIEEFPSYIYLNSKYDVDFRIQLSGYLSKIDYGNNK